MRTSPGRICEVTRTRTAASPTFTSTIPSTIAVGLSIAINAVIVRQGVTIKQGISVQSLAKRLGVKVRYKGYEDEDSGQYFYFAHGTSLKTWGPSVTIDPETGTGRDFGRGFYTFAADDQGLFWAGDWARQSIHGLLDVPIVIVVKIKREEFAELSKRDFRDPMLARAWQPFVKMCRTGQRNYGNAGVVIGPVSNGNNLYPEIHPEIKIPQFKFESGASKLKFVYLYPAWSVLEAGL